MAVRNHNIAIKGNSVAPILETVLTNNQRLLPKNDFFGVVNNAEIYQQERASCNKVRLVVTINPLCSNALFNRITEVVKDEGTDKCLCLNYVGYGGYLSSIDSLSTDTNFATKWASIGGKSLNYFNRKNNNLTFGSVTFTRDTELTADGLGIEYKCGLDIFNNHLLRSKTFKTVCDVETERGVQKKEYFNTIFDTMREANGQQVQGYGYSGNSKIDLHLYLKEEIMDFDESVDKNLDEDNGWLGFVNKGKILSYTSKTGDGDEALPINRVINNKPSCSFIDLCPDRTLWYFTPKFNAERNRFEKNWNYCLTYPYSSTTDVSFIRKDTNSLKIYYFDDNVKISGVNACKIVSFCKHGLAPDDTINLIVGCTNRFNTEDRVIESLKVLKVTDDYTFYVKYSQTDWFYGSNFISWTSSSGFKKETEGGFYEWDNITRKTVKYTDPYGDVHMFPVFIGDDGSYRCNISDLCDNLSFKQVYNGYELEYYVRIFSKIPNWKHAQIIPNDTMTEEEKNNLISKYSTKEYDFESNLSKLAFSKNAYGDDISQIVFNDDIDISNLYDNLGRPVSDIYLTIIKNNAGYRDWYGKNGTKISTTKDTIEKSHVFGKISCAFELSPETIMNGDHQNITQTNNLTGERCCSGLDISSILDTERPPEIEDDEIEYNKIGDYDGDNKFYGDLCAYSPGALGEMVLDNIWYRFNTAQRELTDSDTSFPYFSHLTYDEILTDDYDADKFKEHNGYFNAACRAKEGYKYQPHYKIPVKSISRELNTIKPLISTISSIDYENEVYTIVTDFNNYAELNDDITIFNSNKNEYYAGKVTKVIDFYTFKCTLEPDTKTEEINIFDNIEGYKYIRKQENTPENAVLLRDGSLTYVWRDILPNGYDPYSTNETYPFTNGALYIESNIRLFVRRQDPDKLFNNITAVNDVEPIKQNIITENDYNNEDNINCFT